MFDWIAENCCQTRAPADNSHLVHDRGFILKSQQAGTIALPEQTFELIQWVRGRRFGRSARGIGGSGIAASGAEESAECTTALFA
jgi:hypothetical protein